MINFVMFQKKNEYSPSYFNNEKMAVLGFFMSDIYPDDHKVIRNGLDREHLFEDAANWTTVEATKEQAIIRWENSKQEVVVKRQSLLDAIERFHDFADAGIQAIYILEHQGYLTVTDNPPNEITNYLAQEIKKYKSI